MRKLLAILLLIGGGHVCFGQVFPVKPIGEKSMWIGGAASQGSVTAIQTDLSTLGDPANSYVELNGVKMPFMGFDAGNLLPTYGVLPDVYFDAESWVADSGVNSFRNPAISYYPPLTNWYNIADGTPTNLNIKFFSGTDALQQAEIETKASTNETAQLQSQINSLGIFAVENYLSTNIVNFGYAPTNASRVMCTTQSAGATNFIVTYAATGTYGYVALCTNTTFYTNVAGTATLIDWSSENASGSLTEKFELYAFEKGTTNAVEIGDVAIPQLVPSGTTPTMRTFSIPYMAYGNTNGYYLGIRVKLTANTSGATNKIQWVGGGYNTHIQYSQPSTILTDQFANKDGSNITDPAEFRTAIGADVRPIDRLLVVGDSISATNTGTAYGYPGKTWSELIGKAFPSITISNIAVGGNTIPMQSDALAAVTNFTSSNTYDVATMLIGVNDQAPTNSHSPSLVYSNYVNLIGLAKSNGFDQVCVISMYGFQGSYATNLAYINTLMKGYCYSNQIAWCDAALALNQNNSPNVNTNYTVGGSGGDQHLNEAGARVLASVVLKSVLNGFAPLQAEFNALDADRLYMPITGISRTEELSIRTFSGGSFAAPPILAGTGGGTSYRYDSTGDYQVLAVPPWTTNIIVWGHFGYDGNDTNGVRLNAVYSGIIDTGNKYAVSVIYNQSLSATNGNAGIGTNLVFPISFAIPSTYHTNSCIMVLTTSTPTNNGLNTFCTNYFFTPSVQAQIKIGK
jgi:hypothetical protein